MMALLIYVSIGVMDEKLTERTRIHLEGRKLLSPRRSRCRSRIRISEGAEVLDRARREAGDFVPRALRPQGPHRRASGWDKKKPLPPREEFC